MGRRSIIAAAVALVVLLAGAGAVFAYDSTQRDRIASGISIGGVDVGGLTTAQARARLSAAFQTKLDQPVVLRFGHHRFALSAEAARVRVDIDRSVQQAIRRSRADNVFVRVFRSVTGGTVHVNFDPQVTYSAAAVQGLVTRIARTLNHPPRNATIAISGVSIGHVASRDGITVQTGRLRAAVGGVLANPGVPHSLRIPVTETHPRVTTTELATRYPTLITVDRSTFRLRLWKRLRLVKTYEIAVGMAGLETPAGLYHIQDKQVNPSWHVPNSTWAGSLAGQTIPPGPADPIKARWMGIYNGAGIHGTDELASLGSAASHGCIRMAIPDVIQLYDQTPLGTPVFIA